VASLVFVSPLWWDTDLELQESSLGFFYYAASLLCSWSTDPAASQDVE
jgi:hypothetical protein